MSIVTKRGDSGKTSLCCGTRVMKDDIRVETCGSLDEVSSFLGMAKCLIRKKDLKDIVESIQKDLFLIGSEVATSPKAIKKIKKRICDKEVRYLENRIGMFESGVKLKFKCFSVPGGNEISSTLDIARALTRRTERRSVTLFKKNMIVNKDIIVYLNRLSDLLYLLARAHDKKRGAK